MWVPFNEGWGQYDTPAVRRLDQAVTTRRGWSNNASGWTDRGTGDVSRHAQLPRPRHAAGSRPNRAAVLGEFGGLGLPLQGPLWVRQEQLGLSHVHAPAEDLTNAYASLINETAGLSGAGPVAAVYTQTTDCEIEVNGLMTYDRDVIKIPESVAAEHKRLSGPLPSVKTLVPTAQTTPQTWSFTTKAPPPTGRTGLRRHEVEQGQRRIRHPRNARFHRRTEWNTTTSGCAVNSRLIPRAQRIFNC